AGTITLPAPALSWTTPFAVELFAERIVTANSLSVSWLPILSNTNCEFDVDGALALTPVVVSVIAGPTMTPAVPVTTLDAAPTDVGHTFTGTRAVPFETEKPPPDGNENGGETASVPLAGPVLMYDCTTM
ncbi:MAG TPA: hypothetical protein PKN64_15860, partial [Casimicrobium sp.]|nr:hypothetical protein [Casimicrobium sp.]